MSLLLWPESHSLTFPLRKCKEFQPSTEGVDRRARRSHHYRGRGHKTLLVVSVLAPGIPALPIKLWGSCGCNEVVGTEVAITAQLNCHQHLMEVQRPNPYWTQVFTKLPSEAHTFPACCILKRTAGVWVGWHILCSCRVIYICHLTRLPQTSLALKQPSRRLYSNSSIRFSRQRMPPRLYAQTVWTQTHRHPNIRCQTGSEHFTWILWRNWVPVLVNVKKRKKKKANCAF